MQQKSLLKVTPLTADFDLRIVTSKQRNLVGRNFLELIKTKSSVIAKHLQLMRHSAVFQEEVILDIGSGEERFSITVRKGRVKFVILLVELEPVYKLIEDTALYRKYAFTDNLTGALTRHGYWSALFELLRYAEKLEYNIGIIFADIDNLKKMNTEFGYKGGDLQISEVARTLQMTLRKNDLLVRLGGDEFLVLLPIRPNNKNQLMSISRRILRAVRDNAKLKTTVSLGTQLITHPEILTILAKRDIKKTWDKYIVLADKKVKLAKQTGKNKAI